MSTQAAAATIPVSCHYYAASHVALAIDVELVALSVCLLDTTVSSTKTYRCRTGRSVCLSVGYNRELYKNG